MCLKLGLRRDSPLISQQPGDAGPLSDTPPPTWKWWSRTRPGTAGDGVWKVLSSVLANRSCSIEGAHLFPAESSHRSTETGRPPGTVRKPCCQSQGDSLSPSSKCPLQSGRQAELGAREQRLESHLSVMEGELLPTAGVQMPPFDTSFKFSRAGIMAPGS